MDDYNKVGHLKNIMVITPCCRHIPSVNAAREVVVAEYDAIKKRLDKKYKKDGRYN